MVNTIPMVLNMIAELLDTMVYFGSRTPCQQFRNLETYLWLGPLWPLMFGTQLVESSGFSSASYATIVEKTRLYEKK
jgi:hypothetical protein